MKGIVFNLFTDMVDEAWGEEVTEQLIDRCELSTDGSYSSVGTYCFKEMVSLVTVLSEISGLSVPELLKAFGEHLFGQLSGKYPMFAKDCDDLFVFLETIENTIHVEVKKLYPEAELPTFKYNKPDENTLELFYRSQRPFADLAEGLIRGSINHFGEKVELERENFPVEIGSKATFRLTRV